MDSADGSGDQSRSYSFFRSLDDFGQPVQMTYQGSNAYQTTVGAICTIVAKATILALIAVLIAGLLQESERSSF